MPATATMSRAGIEDAKRALANLHGPDQGGYNTLRRLNEAAFVGERYGAALVADWEAMYGLLERCARELARMAGLPGSDAEACRAAVLSFVHAPVAASTGQEGQS